MKTYLLLLLAFAMKMTSWAQDNMLPTVVDGRSWNVVSIHPTEPPESDSIPPGYYQDIKGRWGIGFPHTFMLKGDTIMGEATYKKLFLDDMFVSGLREEDGRVYERYWEDVPEQLIFDFYLQSGDIFKDEVDDMYQMEVKQVREVDVDGKSRKCMEMWAHMEGMEIVDGLVDYWIEGIGCMNGPHFPFWWEAISFSSLLLSCYDGDECIFTIEDLKQFTSNPSSCPDDNHPHAIDLGLPSGTKWACCNVGATIPEERGGYYAWGETETKSKYDWSNYIHCDGSENTCYDIGSDIAGTEHDVAHVQWGSIWEMPTDGQIQELISNCSYTWTTKNGVAGGLLTGPSGGTIFLPEADICWNGFLECSMPGGYYWSSTLSPKNSNNAYRLCFDSWGGSGGGEYRGIGLTVRPIISGNNYGNINDPNNIIHPKSSTDDTSQAIYDLQGRQLRHAPAKGVYIQDGKKYIK